MESAEDRWNPTLAGPSLSRSMASFSTVGCCAETVVRSWPATLYLTNAHIARPGRNQALEIDVGLEAMVTKRLGVVRGFGVIVCKTVEVTTWRSAEEIAFKVRGLTKQQVNLNSALYRRGGLGGGGSGSGSGPKTSKIKGTYTSHGCLRSFWGG